MTKYTEIPIHLLFVSNKNVRKTLNNKEEDTNIDNLAQDINNNGLINPLSVRKINNKYEIYAGQRRFRAIELLKWKKIPCLISYCKNDNQIEKISLSENIQRNKLTTQEKCNSFYKFYKLNNNNIKKLSKITSLSENTLKHYIKIKEQLNPNLLSRLDNKDDTRITIATAISLSNIKLENQESVLSKLKRLNTDKERKIVISFVQNNPNTNIEKIVDNMCIQRLEQTTLVEDFPWIPDKKTIGNRLKIPEKYYELFYNIIKNNNDLKNINI